jgi:serine/threonine-protein kinase
MPLDEALPVAIEIADALEKAHAKGVTHRDLKPGNVMLRADADDAPVILDFGIAKSLGASSAVHTERRIGTVAYMAPEQLTDGLITPAADIWALGVVLYEAATGQLPFGNFADGRLPQLFDTPPRAATLAPISPALDDLIARCLDRDPGQRPASMAEVAASLRGESEERITADAGSLVAMPPSSPSRPASRDVAVPPLASRPSSLATPPGQRRKRWPLIAAGVACAGAAVIGLLAFRDEPPDELREAPHDETAIEMTPMAAPVAIDAAAPVEPPVVADTPHVAETPDVVDAAATPNAATAEPATKAVRVKRTNAGRIKRTHREPHERTHDEPHERTTSQGETLD